MCLLPDSSAPGLSRAVRMASPIVCLYPIVGVAISWGDVLVLESGRAEWGDFAFADTRLDGFCPEGTTGLSLGF
jgi:hypothetical protein